MPENATDKNFREIRYRIYHWWVEWPYTPYRIVDRAVRRQHELQREAAASDPEWQQIENRDAPDESVRDMFRNWERQWAIENRLRPKRWWEPAARRFLQQPVSTRLKAGYARWQRSRKAWAPNDLWGFDHYLCRLTAEALRWLAGNSWTWPGEHNGWDSAEQWREALIANAEKLEGWTTQSDEEREWVETDVRDESITEDEIAALIERKKEASDKRLAAAKEALHWVADNMELLND